MLGAALIRAAYYPMLSLVGPSGGGGRQNENQKETDRQTEG